MPPLHTPTIMFGIYGTLTLVYNDSRDDNRHQITADRKCVSRDIVTVLMVYGIRL